MNIQPERKSSPVFEIFIVLIIITIFFALVLKYVPTYKVTKENPRFVNVDLQSLQSEASKIENQVITDKAQNVFALTYHVVSKNEPVDEFEISYEQFKETMFALKKEGYQTVSLDDLYAYMNGQKDLPDKSFLITFDDGAKTSFYNADPVLKSLNYTAVMFIITGHSFEGNQSSPYYLNESELKMIQETGRWDLQSHTHESHFRLPIWNNGERAPALTNKLWLPEVGRLETDVEFYDRISSDLKTSDDLIYEKLNKSTIAFALPFGDFGERGSNYVYAHEVVYDLTTSMYDLVFYQFPIKNIAYRGNYPSHYKDSHLIVRLSADHLRTPEDLLKKIESTRVISLPYYEHYDNEERWYRTAGEASFQKDSIILKESIEGQHKILSAYLDGSYLWKDYTYSIKVNNSEAATVSLLGRFASPLDYVMCRYNLNGVSIVNVDDDIQREILSAPYPSNESLIAGTYLSMSLVGDTVSCSINGKEAVNSQVEGIPLQGGVGIRAEEFRNQKEFIFGSISVA